MIKRFVAQTFFSPLFVVSFASPPISTCYTAAVTPFNVYLCCAISRLRTPRLQLLDPNHKHIEPYIFHISVRTHSLLRILKHTSYPYFIMAPGCPPGLFSASPQ